MTVQLLSGIECIFLEHGIQNDKRITLMVCKHPVGKLLLWIFIIIKSVNLCFLVAGQNILLSHPEMNSLYCRCSLKPGFHHGTVLVVLQMLVHEGTFLL